MFVSYTWLKTFFDTELPSPHDVERALMFHAWEIEGVEKKGDDDIIEVNVLPDTASWALSHRGIAKYLSIIIEKPLSRDPLAKAPTFEVSEGGITIDVQTDRCKRFTASRIEGVQVGPSPQWLKEYLEAIGQKSINNIVDAANYVMFDMGQPIHTFDADKLGGEAQDGITVRSARDAEAITTLTGEEYTLSKEDTLIVATESDTPLAIAGVKGGKVAEVDEGTTNLLIECATFDSVAVRKTSQRLKLRTDASQRYENGIVSDMPPYGQRAVIDLILDIAGGTLVSYADVYPSPRTITPVSASLSRINSLLGLSLSMEDATALCERFGYAYEIKGEMMEITPPFERTDLLIEADLIEELGRIYGYEHAPSVTPEPLTQTELNKRFYYAESARRALVAHGFSEIFTSSFREHDAVPLLNALASDKGCLRSTLKDNMHEVLERNRVNADLLGRTDIRVFEIGTVFSSNVPNEGEHTVLALGVRSPGGYKAKQNDPVLDEAVATLTDLLSLTDGDVSVRDGIAEINLDAALTNLPDPEAYAPFEKTVDVTYVPFSPYPFVTRDVALWTEGVTAEEVEQVLVEHAGGLLVHTTLFDTFEKDGKTSYAFRLVFQSHEKTLTDSEINEIMDLVTSAVGERGWEVR